MNQQRFSITTKDFSVDGRQRNSLNLHPTYQQHLTPVSPATFQDRLQLDLCSNPFVNPQRASFYSSISRSIPVVRPRVETAHSYHHNLPQESNLPDYHTEKPINHPHRFYSVEEHHDDFSFRPPNNLPTAYHHHLSITIPDNTFTGEINNSKLTEEVNLLLATHSNPSINSHPQDIANRTSYHIAQKASKFPGGRERSSDQCHREIQRTDPSPYKKPQIYHADDRKVERVTYRPFGSQSKHVKHPIVELSVPKRASNEDALIDVPYIDQDTNWYYLSNKEKESNNQVKYQPNNYSSYGPVIAAEHSSAKREHPTNNNIQNTSTSVVAPIIDYSSLDAFLDGSLLEENGSMSKSTKEWRSSFSTMRNRFGSTPLSPDESVSNNHDFTTNGSMTSPKRGLAKSASQGNLIAESDGHLDSNERQRSLLANAVERRAAEAPELRRPTSRRELGDFWAETIKNRSVTQRTSSPLTAAQRTEFLNESVNEVGSNRSGRRFSGENLAKRKANFLEAVKSSSPVMDRIRSSGIPPSSSIEIKINEPNFASLDSAVAELNNGDYGLNRSGCAKFPVDDLSTFGAINKRAAPTSPVSGALLTHSPSPEATSDTSSSCNAPSGLPHPKPKHNIREQLIQAGFEPRGTAIYVNRSGVRFGSAPNFPIPSNGSVASRISEFEKKPGAPNLLRIACALNCTERQGNETSPIRSPLGPMSPRSSVYRTKPVIHADISGTSLRLLQPCNDVESVFEFPQSKQIIETKM
uniref:DUF3741 domain-containing protein n=1 Tax=Setaria digitata TaxID=48799 RepID=A0A915PJQ7_9BILA